MSVWKAGAQWYQGRRDGHAELWRYVERFVARNQIKSMIEVGGGHGYASELVERYLGIEPNAEAIKQGQEKYPGAEFICGHWTALPWWRYRTIVGAYELFLACAVLEHCRWYSDFLLDALETRARFVVVTFFCGLARETDVLHEVRSSDTDWSRASGTYWDNRYSGANLGQWLDTVNVPWRIDHAGTDTILIIER